MNCRTQGGAAGRERDGAERIVDSETGRESEERAGLKCWWVMARRGWFLRERGREGRRLAADRWLCWRGDGDVGTIDGHCGDG